MVAMKDEIESLRNQLQQQLATPIKQETTPTNNQEDLVSKCDVFECSIMCIQVSSEQVVERTINEEKYKESLEIIQSLKNEIEKYKVHVYSCC